MVSKHYYYYYLKVYGALSIESRDCCTIIDAPDKQTVENHHNKHGVKCEWITEVKTTA